MKLTPASLLLLSAAGASHAFNFKKQVPPDFVENFDWKDPFQLKALASFDASCESSASFAALEYTLHNLMDPHPDGLKPWATGLKEVFSGKEYPGGWAGLDRHLHDRSLLLMDYDKIPVLVREWIEEQERTDGKGKALFAIFDKPKKEGHEIKSVVKFPSEDKIDRSQDAQKVAIFAPGALYPVLPLWAAEGSECKDALLDLARYKPTPADGGVVAWVTHTKPEEKQMELSIKVQSLKTKAKGQQAEKTASKDEL
ncbi:hypothetical protein B0T10DRAFT_1099 [Thelonectria olida]|uniref:Uncharacterized protein n=1 Tax=Thelonectria olida TaxID=1576542 RepID=A0A9P8WHN3_9HYPO|nr:hypothetical protein B0T10DRAFT_1099 [Thelonectria olida]